MLELARRASAVYRRFRRSRHEVVLGPLPLSGPAAIDIGYVDRIAFTPDGVDITGWTRADRITLTCGPATATIRPAMSRPDVPENAEGIARGFTVRLAAAGHPVEACIVAEGTDHVTRVPLPHWSRNLIAEGRVAALYAATLGRHLPQLRAYLLRGDLEAGNLLRAQTGLFGDAPLRVLSPNIFGGDRVSDDAGPNGTGVTVVLPVHGQVGMVRDLLARLADEPARPPFRVIIIDDASPEAEMAPMLQDWCDRHPARFEIITFDRNRGFVAAANAGLAEAAAKRTHAVLLNSDTLPPPGWLGRLIAPILADRSVATVTPFSNDAEILSVPQIARRMAIPEGIGDNVDRMARRLAPEKAAIELPVGIGFCMAMNRDYLDRIPAFDPVFDRGYGEEVDWCRKAGALGGRHLGLASVFVPHIGGASFGSAEKALRVSRNNALVAQRHPRHDAEVQRFIEADPGFDHRFALALALTGAEATEDGLPIVVAHSLGGGAETWLRHHLAERSEAGKSTVVLRAGGPLRWRIELHRPEATQSAGAVDEATVEAYLSMVQRRRVVYSCGVGTPDPRAMVALMSRLSEGEGHASEVLFHDFFPLSPNYTLLGADGVFAGVPDASSTAADHAWPGLSGLSASMTLAEWRAMWHEFLSKAEGLRVFSTDSAHHVATAYPDLADRIGVAPHRLRNRPPRMSRPTGSERVIGILGDLNRAKGAEVVANLSKVLSQKAERPRLAHLGNLDPSYALARGHVRHGAYRLTELPALVERYRISCWLMPSVWPETFSFATHEMLATGLPVFCFPLGAQAGAVAQAPNGHVLTSDPRDPESIAAEIARAMNW